MAFADLIEKYDIDGFIKKRPEGRPTPLRDAKKQLLEYWSLSYDLLQELHGTTKSLLPELMASPVGQDRIVMAFHSRDLQWSEVNEALFESSRGRRSVKTPEKALAVIMGEALRVKKQPNRWSLSSDEIGAWRERKGSLIKSFAQKIADPNTYFLDGAIHSICDPSRDQGTDDLAMLMRSVNRVHPRNKAIELESSYLAGSRGLSYRRVSATPAEQMQKVLTDLANERARNENRDGKQPPVGAISWLIQPATQPFLEGLGFASDKGTVYHYDFSDMVGQAVDRMVDNHAQPFGSNFGMRIGMLYAAPFRSIGRDPNNLKAFLGAGKFPQVGEITIPANVFFHKSP